MDKTKESADFLAFKEGELTIHINNASEYITLMCYLADHGISDPEFPPIADGYDPKYPYFYMEGFGPEREINANKVFTEITHVYPYNDRCIEYESADFASDMVTAQAELILSSMNVAMKDQLYQILQKEHTPKSTNETTTRATGRKFDLGSFSLDVMLQPNGLFDVWIAHEGNSGVHYSDITLGKIGELTIGEIDCIMDSYLADCKSN